MPLIPLKVEFEGFIRRFMLLSDAELYASIASHLGIHVTDLQLFPNHDDVENKLDKAIPRHLTVQQFIQKQNMLSLSHTEKNETTSMDTIKGTRERAIARVFARRRRYELEEVFSSIVSVLKLVSDISHDALRLLINMSSLWSTDAASKLRDSSFCISSSTREHRQSRNHSTSLTSPDGLSSSTTVNAAAVPSSRPCPESSDEFSHGEVEEEERRSFDLDAESVDSTHEHLKSMRGSFQDVSREIQALLGQLDQMVLVSKPSHLTPAHDAMTTANTNPSRSLSPSTSIITNDAEIFESRE